jgi:hypothetical protein
MTVRGAGRWSTPKKPTYTVPSGMGGSFDVRIVADEGTSDVLVRVCMPNSEWHGYEFGVAREKLRPIIA